MAEEEAEGQEESAEESSGGALKWVIIGLVAVLLLGGGGTAFLMLQGGDEAEAEASAEDTGDEEEAASAEAAGAEGDAADGGAAAAAEGESEFFSLEPFIVNINDGERDRFLKLKADLELSSPALKTELERRMPQVKDVIISLLSSQSFVDIKSIEGKDVLREELMVRLNTLVRKGKVRNVFFTEFVVQ